jgi:hypothetical protein
MGKTLGIIAASLLVGAGVATGVMWPSDPTAPATTSPDVSKPCEYVVAQVDNNPAVQGYSCDGEFLTPDKVEVIGDAAYRIQR